MRPGFGTNDDRHRAAAEREAEGLLTDVDFSAPRGGIDFSRHVTEEVLQTYTLQLIGPSNENDPMRGWWLPKLLRETEENLTDLLPDGYSVRIREWDAEEETPNERS